jgi:hypothetical protein
VENVSPLTRKTHRQYDVAVLVFGGDTERGRRR